MKFITWVKPSECINFSAWFEWKSLESGGVFYRFIGFEWRIK